MTQLLCWVRFKQAGVEFGRQGRSKNSNKSCCRQPMRANQLIWQPNSLLFTFLKCISRLASFLFNYPLFRDPIIKFNLQYNWMTSWSFRHKVAEKSTNSWQTCRPDNGIMLFIHLIDTKQHYDSHFKLCFWQPEEYIYSLYLQLCFALNGQQIFVSSLRISPASC